jgi:transcriptional regulator with XRE-family HTH domain
MYEIFEQLLKKYNVTPYRVHKETGVPQSTLSDWKNGKGVPKVDKLKAIADYFHVSVDYLLGNEQKETLALTEKDERDISKRLDQTLSDLENSQGALMFDGEPLDDVTKELLIASLRKDLEMGKRIAKQKFTPKKYRKPE